MTDWIGSGTAVDEAIPEPVVVLTPLQEARADLVVWKAALRAIAAGQSYQMGKTALTRADLAEVRSMVKEYTDQVSRLSKGMSATGGRTRRIIMQDL